jgi:WD40 repeat protein
MTIHPDPTKTLVFAGDKFGQLGIWDALAEKDAKIEEGEDGEVLQMDDGTRPGKNWKVRVHGQNSLSCMKVEPREGKKLFTSSYDCSIRVLDLEKHSSHEVFSILDDDALITNFDITPDGNEVSFGSTFLLFCFGLFACNGGGIADSLVWSVSALVYR